MAELHRIPGTRISPSYILHRQIEQIERIQAVAIVIQWDDGTFDVARSAMPISNLCMAAMVLNDEATKAMRGESGEIITPTEPKP